jgi:hypothetical protein
VKNPFGFKGNRHKVVVAGEPPPLGITKQQVEMVNQLAANCGLEPSLLLQEFVHIGFNHVFGSIRERHLGALLAPSIGLPMPAPRVPPPAAEAKTPEEQTTETAEERLKKFQDLAGTRKIERPEQEQEAAS